MRLFARSLARCGKDVVFEDRDERILNGQSSEVFTNPRTDRATFKTLAGLEVFDSTNTARVATHKLCINYRADVGAEQWVRRADGAKRLRILSAENCCEDDRVLILMCTERGDGAIEVNTA